MNNSDLGSTTSGANDKSALDNVGTRETIEDETERALPPDPFDGGIDLHVVDEEYL